ncbi:MAG: tRNA (adenosine(37)-N6)-threonylcarbamoyltransferase complex dimerization subunit type 1 TsaB [bacterium]|nr:tRNA (adenosine(37)-N6)-threonylcarbamoyltransferase complex dimerization subunit type 1 TsaB [bacterium]
MLLAIDTATAQISLALYDGERVQSEATWHSAQNHTLELAPAVHDLLAHVGGWGAVSALAAAVGPGSYSALRIGVAFAKGAAAARRLPLIGVTTWEILALAQPPAAHELIPLVGAGRGRVTAVRCHWHAESGRWSAVSDPENFTWDALIAGVRARGSPAHLTGEIDTVGAALIAAAAHSIPITLAAPAERVRRAGFLAQEAWTRLAAKGAGAFDPAALVPVYVKTAL